MQKINCETLVKKASELFDSGIVDRALGWTRGEFDYGAAPGIFTSKEQLSEFVWNSFCGANLSKYLIAQTAKSDKKVLIFLKPCDTYSFNQLLTEHRFERNKVYAIAVPCSGMISLSEIKKHAEGISSVAVDGDTVTVRTLYDGDIVSPFSKLLPERCRNCKSKMAVAYDELLGENGNVVDSARFDDVEKIENMTADERYQFWQGELSRCIRCNACRDVCPACTCEKCVFDNPSSGIESKAPSDSFEEKMFHIIRAFHVAGRCTDCGECSRVCPQNIPLHLLNRKFIKDINSFYGVYQAGAEIGSLSPLTDYRTDDIEPAERSDYNA